MIRKKDKKFLKECRTKAGLIVSKYLDILLDDEKAQGAPINQVSSVIGVMMDRFSFDSAEADNGILPEILKELNRNDTK